MQIENDGRNDIDFQIGIWKVHHRMLTQRLKGSNITADSCQWEQALSDDGGKTWETNWIMEFEKV